MDDRKQAITFLPPVEVRQNTRVVRLLVIFLAVGHHDECRKMSCGRLAAFASTGPLRAQQRGCLGSARSVFATEEFHNPPHPGLPYAHPRNSWTSFGIPRMVGLPNTVPRMVGILGMSFGSPRTVSKCVLILHRVVQVFQIIEITETVGMK